MDDPMGHALGAGTEMEHGKNRACRGRWSATARARVDSSAAWFAVHLVGGVGARDGEMGTLVQGLCVLASASQSGGDAGLAVAEDPLSSEIGSSPQARAESTMAICWEGIFRR